MPIPNCNIPFTEEERQHYDVDLITDITELLNGDCWAIVINGIAYMNIYDLIEKINYCFNMKSNQYRPNPLYEAQQKWRKKVIDEPNIILSFLKTVRNSIKIYMFRDHSWMMQIKKTNDDDNKYKYSFFKSEEGLYPML